MGRLHFSSASDLRGDWRDSMLIGEPAVFFNAGDSELSRLEIGPGLVTSFGGAPGGERPL